MNRKSKALKSIAILLGFAFFLFGIEIPAAAQDAVNLVEGLQYTIETGEPVAYSYANYEPDTYNKDTGQLTDGVLGATDANSSAWYRAMRGVSRIVTFDLGALKSVSGFYAGFLHYKTAGIYAPRYVYVYLSENGTDYQKICRAAPDFDLSDASVRRADISAQFDKPYAARYVKVEFCSDIFAYCDEIKVFGGEPTGSEKKITPDKAAAEPGYLKDIDGKSNLIKIYNGYYSDQSIGDNTAEELLPYVAYVLADGSYTDTMFDGVIFVPAHTDYPSGGRLVKTNGKKGAVMSDWLLYLDNTFQEGVNTDALNQVVGEVYAKLGIKNKLTVYYTLPFPTVISEPFGDINGDGVPEYCTTLEERTAILKWFADLTYKRFVDGGYKNLKFGGFYWYREEVNYSETDHEAQLVKNIADYLSRKKLKFLFDPFYLFTGFDHWKALGFDAAVMQPNLVFRDYFSYEMLEEFAQTAKKYNLGVEIETGEPGSFTDVDYKKYGLTYERYLYYGWLTGYMDALHTFYQGAGPGTLYNFCYAGKTTEKGIYLRSLYDKTYKFIKGTYSALPPTVSIPDFETAAGQKNLRVSMTVTDPDSDLSEITVTVTKAPEHGTVTVLSNNKYIIYTAYADYEGTDSFEVVAFDKFSYSEPITVHVKIAAAPALSTETLESVDIPLELGGIKNAVWILISLAAAWIAGVSIAILFVRKKRAK